MSAATTPPPIYSTNSLEATPRRPAGPMQYVEKARYRTAASRARSLYPGPVGELVARELLTIEEFGWTLGAGAFGVKLIEAIEKSAAATTVTAQSETRGPTPRVTPKPPRDDPGP